MSNLLYLCKMTEIKNQETPLSYTLQRRNKQNEIINIPVVDVREDADSRLKAIKMQKESNKTKGSKYMKPAFSVMGLSYN